MVETDGDRPDAEPITSGLVAERAMLGSMLQNRLLPPTDIGHRQVARADMLTYNWMDGRRDAPLISSIVPTNGKST